MLVVAGYEFEEPKLEDLMFLAKPVLKGLPPRRFGKSDVRKLGFYAGRAAAAKALKEAGVEATLVPDPEFGFLRAFHRKGPIEDCYVNISHTRNASVAVVGSEPVGIDVEKADRDTSRVFDRVTSEEERHTLPGEEVKLGGGVIPYGVALWCSKEAFSKAVGLGIKFGMRDFHIDLKTSPPHVARSPLRGPIPVKEPAVLLWREKGLVVAVCGERQLLAGSGRLSMVFEKL